MPELEIDVDKLRKDLKYLRWALAGAEIFSTCSKAQYLAIIVDRFGTVAATGYNGSPSGWDHCTDGACPRAPQATQGGSYSNCISVHAEANALIRVSPRDCERGTIYIGGLPCWDCAKLIIGAGLTRVVYLEGRRPVDEDQIRDLFKQSGSTLIGVEPHQVGIAPAQTLKES